jgi:hypothetical protein
MSEPMVTRTLRDGKWEYEVSGYEWPLAPRKSAKVFGYAVLTSDGFSLHETRQAARARENSHRPYGSAHLVFVTEREEAWVTAAKLADEASALARDAQAVADLARAIRDRARHIEGLKMVRDGDREYIGEKLDSLGIMSAGVSPAARMKQLAQKL